METRLEQRNSQTIIHLSGEMVRADCEEFRTTALKQLSDGVISIFLNMSSLRFIDSAALGALMGVRVSCEKYGAQLVLVSPSDEVNTLLKAFRFDQVFQIRSVPDTSTI